MPHASVASFARPVGFSARQRTGAAAAGLLLALVGAVALVRTDIAQRREAFAADARTAHRLLSQHAAQLDAVLATLVLLAPGAGAAEQRLPALLPAVLQVLRRDEGQAWADPALAAAEAQSRALPAAQRHAVLGPVDAALRQYTVVLAGSPTSYALRVDARRLVPAEGWPLATNGPVRVLLAASTQGQPTLVLHAGAPGAQQPSGLTPGYTFSKVLATPSQPFEVQLQRATGPAQWPWAWLLVWAAACAAGTATALVVLRARQAQRRSAELVRLAQVARLNTLGELAAGMAHELNQPLAAVLASSQAALRLLRQADGPGDDGPDLPAARQALGLAALQARRAADVVARLRRLVQDPTRSMALQPVDLQALLTQLLHLLAPELQRQGIHAQVLGKAPAVWADPVALEQVVHNLLGNAMQALQGTHKPAISLLLRAHGDLQAQLLVRDNGPGITPENHGRVFEPFFSTHAGGLGLGLPLCESLAQAMGGDLVLLPATPGAGLGAAFQLNLRVAPTPAPTPTPTSATTPTPG